MDSPCTKTYSMTDLFIFLDDTGIVNQKKNGGDLQQLCAMDHMRSHETLTPQMR